MIRMKMRQDQVCDRKWINASLIQPDNRVAGAINQDHPFKRIDQQAGACVILIWDSICRA
jgi:hypothetical protein